MRKYLIALLALICFSAVDSRIETTIHAQAEPVVSDSLAAGVASSVKSEARKASDLIKSDLITAPDHVSNGGYFTVRTPPGLDYEIKPQPKESFRTVEEGTGDRILFVLYAVGPSYTITINHAVVHPTAEEIESAPWDDRVKFKVWLTEHSTDEVYQDSHTVTVGDAQPDPKPDPGPKPDPSPQPSGPYWIIFLEESNDRGKFPHVAQILADVTFLKSLTDAGHKWRVYDDDDIAAKPFAQLTTIRPALIITSQNGEIIKTMEMPKTKEDIQKELIP